MSDTPRTDSSLVDISGHGLTVHTRFVQADVARSLERELAAQKVHADAIYKAGVELSFMLENRLSAERALADRLAHWLDILADDRAWPEDWEAAILSTLTAWKEARP